METTFTLAQPIESKDMSTEKNEWLNSSIPLHLYNFYYILYSKDI